MIRRELMLAVAALVGLAFGAPAAAADFRSDRISVTAEGSGPDVILIPGMTSSPSAWRATNATIPGYRYHYVQVKGFAGTPPEANADGGPVAVPVAEEIARYIVEGKLERPAVIGHSMGGTMAMILAARHPGSVSKIMVVDQVPFMGVMFGPPGTTAESVRPTADAILARFKASTPEESDKRIVEASAGMVRNPAHRRTVIAEGLASDRTVTRNAFHELIVTDLRPELAKITVPATVLYVTPAGVPLSDAQIDAVYAASYSSLKEAKLVRIPESAHFIMADNPERYRSEMKAFLLN